MARDKFTFYIIWQDENGDEQRKDYSAAGGRNYWKEKIVNTLGAKAVIEEGKEATVQEGGKTIVKKFVDNEREKLLGPVDQELSIFGTAPIKGRFVMSNWNTQTRTYTSRLYGGLNDMFKVIEPDGAITLSGQDIIKRTDKETGTRTMIDGRKFTNGGWPIPSENETIYTGFIEEEEPVIEKAPAKAKRKTAAKKAAPKKPAAKKPAAKKPTAKRKTTKKA